MDLVPLMAAVEDRKLNAPNDKSKEEMENAPFKLLTQPFPEAVATPDSLSQSLHTSLPISLLLTEPKGHVLHVSEPSELANVFGGQGMQNNGDVALVVFPAVPTEDTWSRKDTS